MIIRVCHWKVVLCSPRSCVFFTCVFAFLFVTVNVITIHSYQTIHERHDNHHLLSVYTAPVEDPTHSITSSTTPHPITSHSNISNHHSARTARKTLNLTGRLRPTGSLLGESFNPFQYISSQRTPPNETNPMKNHYFNQAASDLVGYKRQLWDMRDEMCKRVHSVDINTSVSVIICFHNEARSALLRTIHSVLDKTPDSVLKEVLVIDDFSDDVEDGNQLNLIPQVKVIRLDDRQGLVRARLVGSKHASGEVLVFLDSHCEATTGWIQPLITRIHKCKKCIVSPVIDIINKNTMKYVTSQVNIKGGFDRSLFFKWVKLNAIDIERRRLDVTAPIATPAIAGGLFAINKDVFNELGLYDEEMDIWGGENIEFSMRVWMCGARLEIMPCSRVGHIFRSTMPYTFGRGKTYLTTVVKNLCRTAEVWMDESKSIFYSEMPLAKDVDFGNVTARQTLRESLHCKSFQWYLNNIYPEFRLNYTSPRYVQLHQLNRKCITIVNDGTGRRVRFKHCELIIMGPSNDQIWELTSSGQIKHGTSCLTVRTIQQHDPIQPMTVSVEECIPDDEQDTVAYTRQLFTITETGDQQNIIQHTLTNSCMTATTPLPTTTPLTLSSDIHLVNCTSTSVNLKWSFRKLL